MIGESLAIVIVLLLMAVMYRRAGRKLLAALTLPLICVPCGKLLGMGLLGPPDDSNLIASYGLIVLGLVATVALCTLLARAIPSRSVRIGYLGASFIFSGALVIAYLVN